MADRSDLASDDGSKGVPLPGRRRMVGRIALGGAGIAALALGVVWGSRDRIATDLIDRQLAALNLPARYRIESIGLGREVLGAVAVGDPAHPDLTIERVEIALRYGYAGPELDRITLVRPRFHGRLVGGRISLGSLDRVLYGPSSGAVRLPDWSLALVDARGRIETPYGLVGLSADGRGRLSDGFAGTLGAIVPQAQFPGPCMLARTTLYASVTTSAGRPRLAGPLRIGSGQCGRDTRFAPGKVDLAIGGDATLANWTLGGHWALGRIDSGRQLSLTGISGDAGLRFQSGRNQAPAGDLAGRITIAVNGLTTPALRLGNAKLDGVVHVRPGQGLELRGDCVGTALSRGPATLAMLDRARTTTRGTPFGPLLDRLATTLAREEPGSRLAGSLGLHRDGMGWRIAVPSLALRGGRSGQALARLDQFALTAGADGVPRLSGDFTTGGADFPAISGTMQFAGAGTAHLQLAMEHYGAAGADLAIPRMAVTQSRNGSLAFSGTAALSGPVGEGGRIDNLVMPVEGAVATDGQIALLRHCVRPSFDRLRTGTLDLARNAVTLCPVGGAIVRTNGAGAQIAATMPAFALAGRSSDAPLSVRAGGARIAWPGGGAMKSVDVALGAGAQANRLHLAEVTIARGSTAAALGGTFTGGVVAMPALPATVDAAGGDWRLEGARLTLGGAAFTLADRVNPGRFAPVAVRNARMTLVDGAVDATAHLVAPKSAADLGDVIVHHDLTSGKGFAQVAIAGVTFRDPAAKDKPTAPGLQPADLSDLAKGVVANASGTIRGKARFDWNSAAPDGGVRGSGTFSSDDFDFAAALGPVEGLSGTIEFTDLVHLVTAPHQILKIASINPGIEVIDGMVDLELRAGQVVRLNRAQWPFEGGTIHLEPTDLNMAVSEPRKLTLVIAGLEAGRFLQHTNMSNLSATGMFDGRLPLVFDAQGGRIVGGQLVSRPPGGNVSYVGALSYRDLSPMANFAFRMLRSVDYASMTIGMDGDLAGEVITRVSFGGIHQGKGAERNLITRQLAALPIRFDVNVRAQFYQLVGSLRSLYDPSLVRDPRELGLVDAQGRPIHHHGQVGVAPPGPPPSATSSSIQHQASGTMP